MTYTNFSFSSVWNTQNHKDGALILERIVDLGFLNVELNFQFSQEKLDGVFAFLAAHPHVRVSGVHNYCPAPTEEVELVRAFPDCFSVAATDEAERKKAVAYTKRSIETAKKLGGRYVVMHSGQVAMKSRMRQLINLAKDGKKDTAEFRSIQGEMIAERADTVREHFDAVCTSYEEITQCAIDHDILIGVENRFYFRELPGPSEIEKLLHYFKGRNLGYWHDVGHACMQEAIGFYKPGEYIERFHHDMIGAHLHDIINLRDHYMPGTGEVDYQALRSFLKKDIVKTIEIHGHQKPADIQRGMHVLQSLFEKA